MTEYDPSTWLRETRTRAGRTQSDIASIAGVSQAQISQAEAGKRSLRAEHILAISKALGEPPPGAEKPVTAPAVREALQDGLNLYWKARDRWERRIEKDSVFAGVIRQLRQEFDQVPGAPPDSRALRAQQTLDRIATYLTSENRDTAVDNPEIAKLTQMLALDLPSEEEIADVAALIRALSRMDASDVKVLRNLAERLANTQT